MRLTTLLVALAVILSPAGLEAQACLGSPALGVNSSGNIGLGASFFDGGKSYGGGGTFGGPVFGQVSFGYADYDDTTLSLKSLSAAVGYEVSSPNGLSVCPVVGATYGFGLELFGVDVAIIQFIPGLAIGYATEVSPAVEIAPFARAAFVYNRFSFDAGPIGDASESDTFGIFGFGVSLIFNNRFSIGPAVSIPIGADDGDTAFGVAMNVAVGG